MKWNEQKMRNWIELGPEELDFRLILFLWILRTVLHGFKVPGGEPRSAGSLCTFLLLPQVTGLSFILRMMSQDFNLTLWERSVFFCKKSVQFLAKFILICLSKWCCECVRTKGQEYPSNWNLQPPVYVATLLSIYQGPSLRTVGSGPPTQFLPRWAKDQT